MVEREKCILTLQTFEYLVITGVQLKMASMLLIILKCVLLLLNIQSISMSDDIVSSRCRH